MVGTACTAPARVEPPIPTTQPPGRDVGMVTFPSLPVVDGLTLREQIGQLVIPFLPGTYSARDGDDLASVHRWIDSLGIGGLIVSLGSPLDIAAKLNDLQTRSRLPLLVASDLEGGSAFRFLGGTPFPTNMGVAATGRTRDAYVMGEITAQEARAVGVHLVFAPVADVNNNPANPIINTRSFGEDPAQVGRLVAATVRGLQDQGVLATAKHFPGHGDTEIDTHLALPVNPADWARLDSIELVPFRAAVAAGVTGVMSAHIALPVFDTAAAPRAGTMAPNILTGLLRDSLGFRGVVVTDALNMRALVGAYGPGETAVLAFLAGADLLLMPTDPGVIVDAMEQAVQSGRISPVRLRVSVDRMLALKRRAGLDRARTVPLDAVTKTVARPAFMEAARDVTARSLVLVRDSASTFDRVSTTPGTLALITYGETNWGTFGGDLARVLQDAGVPVSVFRLNPASGTASYDSARAVLRMATRSIAAVSVRPNASKGHIAMPEALVALLTESANAQPTLLVSFGSPYLLLQAPTLPGYLLAWTVNALTETAVARALLGAPMTGTLPIAIPPLYPIGHGLERSAR